MQSDTSQTTGSHYIFLNNFGHQSVGIQSFVCNRGTQFCVTAGSTLIYISANEGVRHSVLSALSVYLKIFPYRKKYIHKYLCKAFMVHTMTFLSLFCTLLRNKQVLTWCQLGGALNQAILFDRTCVNIVEQTSILDATIDPGGKNRSTKYCTIGKAYL